MARNIHAGCKMCRRYGEKLYLKSEKCYTDKCSLHKRGQRVESKSGKISVYSMQLREKQKAKAIYGVLEKQFKRYYEEAIKKPNPGLALLSCLERRLDNIVYRLRFADSRTQARQLVAHGHILVNFKRVNASSYQVKVGDEITVAKGKIFEVIKKNLLNKDFSPPSFLSLDRENCVGEVLSLPSEEDLKSIPISTQQIIEFYSK